MAITLHTEEIELPEQTDLVTGRRRDEFQRMVDGDVLIKKVETAAAGWPEPDPAKLFQRYVVDAEDVSELKGNIRRAGTLHKVDFDFYKDGKTEKGLAVVKFHVARKLDKDEKPVADATLTDAGKPTPELAKEAADLKAARAEEKKAAAEAAKQAAAKPTPPGTPPAR